MQCLSELLVLLAALVFCISSVFAVPLEKKADIAAFTSAINGAGRLRYGKRSDPAIWEQKRWFKPMPFLSVYHGFRQRASAPLAEEYVYPEGRYPYSLIKRALNTDSLVASLNAAERLRFGRK